jgi:hypothetical protein
MAINSLKDVSVEQLRRAIAVKERIEGLENELQSILEPARVDGGQGVSTRRRMSSEARARIAAAARARWAKVKAGQMSSPQPGKKKRRTMSPEARARIAAAARARWARVKAGKK